MGVTVRKGTPARPRGTEPKHPDQLASGAQRTYRDGFWACRNGLEISANPYTALSPPWHVWRRGYNFARFNETSFGAWSFSDLQALELALEFCLRFGDKVRLPENAKHQNHHKALMAKWRRLKERKTWKKKFSAKTK